MVLIRYMGICRHTHTQQQLTLLGANQSYNYTRCTLWLSLIESSNRVESIFSSSDFQHAYASGPKSEFIWIITDICRLKWCGHVDSPQFVRLFLLSLFFLLGFYDMRVTLDHFQNYQYWLVAYNSQSEFILNMTDQPTGANSDKTPLTISLLLNNLAKQLNVDLAAKVGSGISIVT